MQQRLDDPSLTNLQNAILNNKEKKHPTVQEHPY